MSIGTIFWVLMIIWFAFGLWSNRAAPGPWFVGNGFMFVLFFLLGWAVFGFVIHR